MKGFVIQGDGQPPKLVTMEKPEPKLNEALVKVLRAGICGTDLAMINNYKAGFKGVLGHEFVGLVERVGDPRDPEAVKWIGKRVVGEINIACRQQTCNVCARPVDNERYTEDHVSAMKRSHCPNRVVVGILGHHGAFAEYLTLPLENLSVVPDAVFESHVAFVEPLAAACRIVEQKVIQPTDDVAVLGDGKLGLLIAEALRATKAASKLVVIGKHREKLALVRNVASECHEVSPHLHRTMRDRFDVCVESTGSPAGIAFALDIVKPGGVLVIKSTCASKKSPVNLELMQNKGIRLVGSRCGPFDVALKLLAEKKVDVQKYIEGVYPLERAEHALEHAKTRGTLKIQLVM
ncbi:TPA: hypothetical protein N0F65_007881 [Lagenidium giganteum]|uniref:Alcohol dehydrogenase n=1 Tax=Lagenidium giganteum TaxID=4803 RepID=A0AAV2Z457_9STRA|nr:TPA: hypothetical protein N0F65_007881 [Lagenidium giganteum]